ncbi:MAG: hypothetical protein AAFU79_00560, partial [Myxococcota bacterium]
MDDWAVRSYTMVMPKRWSARVKMPNLKPVTVDDQARWPSWVPVLGASDMHQGWYDSECGSKHCLLGHIMKTFPRTEYCSSEFLVESRIREYCQGITDPFVDVDEFNDDHATPGLCARVWNKTMADFG